MSLVPILFSMPTENGEYQLFGPTTTTTIKIAIDPSAIHPLSPEEIEKINQRQIWIRLSVAIDNYLEKNREDNYHLTKYTLLQIDEIQVEVYIYCDYHDNLSNSYYYKIISKNIEYGSNIDMIEKDLLIYESASFYNTFSLLEHIKIVETTYKFLDYYLLSPEKMEEAKAQREYMPISQDKVCSVCYELTVEYTTCKHSICLKCRDKCIVQGKTRCPICRGSELNIYPNTL